mmetsp:Transcript_46373/g.119685  ORF Transcript_46373/g.119685 Transcript_46373/m.119685 type:complete len:91 (+) Transcript_46373:229-501(+)
MYACTSIFVRKHTCKPFYPFRLSFLIIVIFAATAFISTAAHTVRSTCFFPMKLRRNVERRRNEFWFAYFSHMRMYVYMYMFVYVYVYVQV